MRVAKARSYAYDAAGNMTNDSINVLTYDGENRVVTSTQSGATYTYSYDGNGLRVEKTPPAGSAAVYIFSGSKVVAEYAAGAAAGSPSTEYIYSGAQLLRCAVSDDNFRKHDDLSACRSAFRPSFHGRERQPRADLRPLSLWRGVVRNRHRLEMEVYEL